MGITFQAGSGGGGGGGQDESVITTPTVSLSSGQFYSERFRIADGDVVEVNETGVETRKGSLPTGLATLIRDDTNDVVLFSKQTKKETGDPVASLKGPAVIEFRADNQSSGGQNINGHHVVEVKKA